MKQYVIETGSLVKAVSGRDKNKYFVVVEVNDGCVLIVDGDSRKIDSPKLKNVKHVKPTGLVVQEVIERYPRLTDKELNRIIKDYSGRIECQRKM